MNLDMDDEKKMVHFSCRMSEELKHVLRIVSSVNGLTMSEQAEVFIRSGVDRFIRKHPGIESLVKKVL